MTDPVEIDNDSVVFEDMQDSLFSLEKAYLKAKRRADLNAMQALKPQLEAAANAVGKARLKLLDAAVLATDDDVATMRRIKAEIDQAASTQQLIEGAIKLVGMVAKFV